MSAAAQRREVLTYGELTEFITVAQYNANDPRLEAILDKASRRTNAAGCGMLSVVVVNQQTRLPGDGFFTLARELRRVFTDDREFFEYERDQVFDAHATNG